MQPNKIPVKFSGGYTLIEAIAYIAVLAVVIGAVMALVIGALGLQTEILINRSLNTALVNSLDRLDREIKNAEAIDWPASDWSTNPGRLVLTSGLSGQEIIFAVDEDDYLVMIVDGDSRPIIPQSVAMSELIFRPFQSDRSEGIKIELTFQSRRQNGRQVTAKSSAIIRSSY